MMKWSLWFRSEGEETGSQEVVKMFWTHWLRSLIWPYQFSVLFRSSLWSYQFPTLLWVRSLLWQYHHPNSITQTCQLTCLKWVRPAFDYETHVNHLMTQNPQGSQFHKYRFRADTAASPNTPTLPWPSSSTFISHCSPYGPAWLPHLCCVNDPLRNFAMLAGLITHEGIYKILFTFSVTNGEGIKCENAKTTMYYTSQTLALTNTNPNLTITLIKTQLLTQSCLFFAFYNCVQFVRLLVVVASTSPCMG